MLTGKSGFIGPGLHVAASYSANSMVFVEYRPRWAEGHIWRKRMTLARATREKRKIIKCRKCSKPAAQLDHHWPYFVDDNLCAKHLPKER